MKPVGSLLFSDYESDIRVEVKNTGVGPLLVTSLEVTDGKEIGNSVIQFMPELPEGLRWATFTSSIDGWCIPAGDVVMLIQLKGQSAHAKFNATRDDVRLALSRLTATIKYKDVYERELVPNVKSLAWFGRRLKQSDSNLAAAKSGNAHFEKDV